MRITYLKLENFIGIHNGMGKTEIEIKFSKTDNIINLLQGPNGCGKTTILSCLHPFAGTMDARNEIILPNCDGRKIIKIKDKGNLYKIEHIYLNNRKTPVTKSFFAKYNKKTKEYEELNSQGTVKSFERLVKEILDVTPDFFVISRIGSNVKNFTGQKTAERKNYMSNFLPDVSSFLERYKIINEKSLDINKRIKAVSTEINKLDNEESLNNQIINLNSRLSNLNTLKDNDTKDLYIYQGKSDKLKEDKRYISLKNNLQNYNEKEEFLRELRNELDEHTELFEKIVNLDSDNDSLKKSLVKLDKLMVNLKDKLNDDTSIYEVQKSKYKSVMENIDSLNESITSNKIELDKYQTDYDLDEYKNLLKEYKKTLKLKEKEISKIDCEKYTSGYNDTYFNQIISLISKLSSSINTLFSTKEVSVKEEFISLIENNTDISLYANTLKILNNNIVSLNNKIIKLNNELSIKKNNVRFKEILNKRPSTCKIDSCPFIKDALQFSDILDEIVSLEEEIESKKKEVKKIEIERDNVSSIYDINSELNKLYKNMVEGTIDTNIFYLKKYFKSYKVFITNFINIDKDIIIDHLKKSLSYSILNDEIKELNKNISNTSCNIKSLEGKDSLIKKLNKDLQDNIIKVSKLEKELNDYNTEIKTLSSKIKVSKEFIEILKWFKDNLNNYIITKEELLILEEEINNNKKLALRIKKYKKKMEELNDNISSYEEEIKPLTKELEELNYNLKRLSEFHKELEDLNKKSFKVDAIKKALSPTKGIPLYFVQKYLKKTKIIANKLLDIAYDGKLFIYDFQLTENDFFIKIVKENGIIVKDVLFTSQGETSMINTAISLAMVQQSMKKYNIPLLDEVDKELDEDNRRAFISIIQSQLKELKVEQCFIISHNNEFDNCNLDLLLFPGNTVETDNTSFMNGKNIQFQV